MRLRVLISVFRTPLILLVGALLLVFNETLIPNLVLILNYYSTPASMPGAFSYSLSLRLDYLLYPPNVVTFLACIVGVFVLLEAKYVLLPCNRNVQWDLVTTLACLSVALFPLPLLTNTKVGCLQLLISGAQVMFLWLFMVFNVGLWVFDRYLASRRWFARLLDWTFPVSDVVFYMFHRQRIGPGGGLLRFMPMLSYVAIIAVVLWMEAGILTDSIGADKMPVPLQESYFVVYDDGGFWFSNSDWWDSRSGIWYYDERSHVAYPYIRILDSHKFYLEDGFFYFYDRYDSEVLKVDAKTRQVAWRTPVKRGFGTFELAIREDLIFAVGENGYILVMDKDGAVRAEQAFPFRTMGPQVLPDGRIAFVSGDPCVRIWNSSLTAGETIQLPLPDSVIKFQCGNSQGSLKIVTAWSEYVDRLNTLYVGTFWGEIFRYDVNHRQWLPSLKTRPGLRSFGIDSRNSLLFASNYYQGFIEVIDLESGKHLKYILANAFGRFINLDPSRMTGILNTRGYGMYQFKYGEIATSRFPIAHNRQQGDYQHTQKDMTMWNPHG